eukprot:16442408-Heterocapsa_arctica.AAC.1
MRVFEHLRVLLRPQGAEGKKPRYRLLRQSLGSAVMIPALGAASEARAYSLEFCAIRLEAPAGNALDEQVGAQATGKKYAVCLRSGRRRRPSSWRRAHRPPWASVWGDAPTIAMARRREEPRFPELQGARGIDLPCKDLYAVQGREAHGLH